MKPDLARFFEVAAAHLMARTAPALGSSYEQSSAMILGVMLTAVSEEMERAASRRVEENGELRRLFAAAAPVVRDASLRERLLRASEVRSETDFRISALEEANAELRALLIGLHAHVESLDTPEARHVNAAIWRELARSTERRRLSIGPF